MVNKLTLFAVLLCCCPCVFGEDVVRDSTVKIHVTSRAPDFLRPWTKANPKKSSGSGAIIDGNRILTNYHVVRYAKQIFAQFNQSTERHAAEVVVAAPELDLALLKLEVESELEGRPHLEIQGGIPEFKGTVNVYGYPMGGDDLAVTEGIISRIEYASLSGTGSGLRIQVDAALNPGNSGGPAIVDKKITGLVFSGIREADGIGYLIPADEIIRFLDDAKDGKYDGKPNLFDDLQTTENSALRDKLQLKSDQTGIMVKQPYRDDDDYQLQPWDVITKVGEELIDNKGQVRVREDLRLMFQYFIPQLAHDGLVDLTVYRNGKEVEIQVPVQSEPETVFRELRGTYPRHFICGPVVFTVVSRDLLRTLGTKGVAYLSAMESPIISRTNVKPQFPGEEIVLLRLLPHRLTKGYDTVPFGNVAKINGTDVKNLQHTVEIIRDCTDEFLTLEMGGNFETIVFNRQELIDSTEDVLSDEGIRYQYSDDLKDVWETKTKTDDE